MIGIVGRRTVNDLAVLTHRVIVGKRDCLGMRDQKAVEMARRRRPGAHPRTRSGPVEIDGAARARLVSAAIRRKMPLVRAPAEFGGLGPLAHEAVDRPGVDEFVGRLRHVRDLGVAFRDVHHLHAQPLSQRSPIAAAGRHRALHAGIGRNIEQRLLHQMRDQARVGAMGQHGSGRAHTARAQPERLLANGVVGALRRRQGRVDIAARPGFDAGVEKHRAFFPAVADQRDARDVHRDIQQQVAAPEQRIEHAAETLAGERLLDELDPVAGRLLASDIIGSDDCHTLGTDADMPQDQRQHTLANAAEADKDNVTGKLDVDLICARLV